MLLSSPEQEIKSLVCGTPAFIGEVAYMAGCAIYPVSILLGSLKFESVAGVHFDPRAHRCRKSDSFDVLTLSSGRTGFVDGIHEYGKIIIKLVSLK